MFRESPDVESVSFYGVSTPPPPADRPVAAILASLVYVLYGMWRLLYEPSTEQFPSINRQNCMAEILIFFLFALVALASVAGIMFVMFEPPHFPGVSRH